MVYGIAIDRCIKKIMKTWTGLSSVSSKKGVVFQWIKSFGVVPEDFLGHGNRSPGGVRSTGFPDSSFCDGENAGTVKGQVDKHATIIGAAKREKVAREGDER